MSDEYVAYIQEKLEKLGKISFKKMFGGRGVYSNKLFIGIIAYGELYFKANDDIISIYKQYNSEQFCYTYPKSNKEVRLNWWKVVDEILEDDELLKLCYIKALKMQIKLIKRRKLKSRMLTS